MARRDRVPRHKSHNHKRNKNAKLSPFQREQKRTKLANQVPTASTIGDLDSIPHSQRHVFNYLQEKMQRQKDKRAKLDLERQQQAEQASESAAAEASASTGSSATTTTKKSKKTASAAAAAAEANTATSAASTKKGSKMVYASLNDELTASMGAVLQPLRRRAANGASTSSAAASSEEAGEAAGTDASTPRTVEEIIARKKERKHKRKQEARRLRVAAQMEDIEAEIEDYAKNVNGISKKKKQQQRGEAAGVTMADRRDRANVAFEKKLRAMQKEKASEEAAAARQQREEAVENGTASRKRTRGSATRDETDDGNVGEAAERKQTKRSRVESSGEGETAAAGAAAEEPVKQRKRISFDPEVPDPNAAQAARRAAKEKKPHDFYDLVDVVRYGERVVAPPVFDVVPNHNAAVSRLANQLEQETAKNRGRRGAEHGGNDERHRLLAGAGQLGQQKRLARLGLAPAITHTVRPDGSGAAKQSKAEEIAALRDRVLATYQRNRKKEVVVRKGVDMHHEFPKFS